MEGESDRDRRQRKWQPNEIVINNRKAWNKETPNKWREVVNNNVNEESERVA